MTKNEFEAKIISARIEPDYDERGNIVYTKDYYDLVDWFEREIEAKSQADLSEILKAKKERDAYFDLLHEVRVQNVELGADIKELEADIAELKKQLKECRDELFCANYCRDSCQGKCM